MKHYLFLSVLFITALSGCSKSDDTVKPESRSELLTRKWTFSGLSVKTDVKSYVIPGNEGDTFFGEDNTVTFNADNTYSVLENGKTTEGGTWKLSADDKTLTLTDTDKIAIAMSVNTLTKTDIELATKSVDITKSNPTMEELNVGLAASILLYSLDIDFGGTVDFSKEPDYKTLQIILKGKGL
ncbi:hypothetical protein [Larkinella bovis]